MQNPTYYLATYIMAFVVAVAFVYFNRKKKRRAKFRAVLRFLFTPKIWFSPSSRLDFKYATAAMFLFPTIMAYTVVSAAWIGISVAECLRDFFGPMPVLVHSNALFIAVMSVTLYIAYEFAYWVDHYASHKIKFLWEFHKVHHSAMVLTPFTTWRIHSLDSVIFANISAGIVGVSQGLILYSLGHETTLAAMNGNYMLTYATSGLYGILQHSQLWIPFTGFAGRIFCSPAHHQIHHSNDPIHYNKNLGSTLAIFDWLFGTLYVPAKQKELIAYGTDDDAHLKKFVTSILYPFYLSWGHIKTILPRGRALVSREPVPEHNK